MGIKRRIDNLGRVVIPIEFRKQINLSNATENLYIDMEVTENYIILRKTIDCCHICSEINALTEYKKIFLCSKCIENIKETF